jgi:hypothetical protein
MPLMTFYEDDMLSFILRSLDIFVTLSDCYMHQDTRSVTESVICSESHLGCSKIWPQKFSKTNFESTRRQNEGKIMKYLKT